MKTTLIIIFVLTTVMGIAQNKKALKLFDKGVEAFNKKDFKTADSLFALSAKLEPNRDTYFNIAAVKNELGDRCGFCENMLKSSVLGNKGAVKLYDQNCIKKDTFSLITIKEKNIEYSYIVLNHYCLSNTSYYFNKSYFEKGEKIINSYLIDTVSLKISDLTSEVLDIEKAFKDHMPYNVVTEMPSYPGGDEARNKFIAENIVYPVMARENNIQGTVYTTFIIEPDGTLKDIRVFQGIGGGCDEECIRVIKLMPKWNPGKLDGKAVRVQFNLTIKFTLQ
jgi:TonB family protein